MKMPRAESLRIKAKMAFIDRLVKAAEEGMTSFLINGGEAELIDAIFLARLEYYGYTVVMPKTTIRRIFWSGEVIECSYGYVKW